MVREIEEYGATFMLKAVMNGLKEWDRMEPEKKRELSWKRVYLSDLVYMVYILTGYYEHPTRRRNTTRKEYIARLYDALNK